MSLLINKSHCGSLIGDLNEHVKGLLNVLAPTVKSGSVHSEPSRFSVWVRSDLFICVRQSVYSVNLRTWSGYKMIPQIPHAIYLKFAKSLSILYIVHLCMP